MLTFVITKKNISDRIKIMSEQNQNKISVKEFKAMIHGMDLLGGDEWAPNIEQWKRIRTMISNLEDEPAVVVTGPTSVPAMSSAPTRPVSVPSVEQPTAVPSSHNPLENDNPGFMAPAPPSSIPSGPVTMGQSSSGLAPVPRPSPPKPRVDEKGTIKTPDIDTSDGYNSSYV